LHGFFGGELQAGDVDRTWFRVPGKGLATDKFRLMHQFRYRIERRQPGDSWDEVGVLGWADENVVDWGN